MFFEILDSNSGGKITKDAMTTVVQKLLSKVINRPMEEGPGGPAGPQGPPPPPQEKDEGFTKDELTSQLQEIGASDKKRSALISKIIENFDEADTDGDGKVTFAEAKAHDTANQTADAYAAVSSEDDYEEKMTLQLMKLLHAYNISGEDTGKSDQTGLSINA